MSAQDDAIRNASAHERAELVVETIDEWVAVLIDGDKEEADAVIDAVSAAPETASLVIRGLVAEVWGARAEGDPE